MSLIARLYKLNRLGGARGRGGGWGAEGLTTLIIAGKAILLILSEIWKTLPNFSEAKMFNSTKLLNLEIFLLLKLVNYLTFGVLSYFFRLEELNSVYKQHS